MAVATRWQQHAPLVAYGPLLRSMQKGHGNGSSGAYTFLLLVRTSARLLRDLWARAHKAHMSQQGAAVGAGAQGRGMACSAGPHQESQQRRERTSSPTHAWAALPTLCGALPRSKPMFAVAALGGGMSCDAGGMAYPPAPHS